MPEELTLKRALIQAKIEGLKVLAKTAGNKLEDSDIEWVYEKGSAIEVEAELTTKAIVDFLTKIDFRITELKAPVIVEEFRIPEQPVNVEPQTLMGDKAPIIDVIAKIPGAAALAKPLKDSFKKAIAPLLEGGCTAPELDLSKDAGGLESTGYVFIGSDPDSKNSFSVETEDGQREHTKVKLLTGDDWEALTGLGE